MQQRTKKIVTIAVAAVVALVLAVLAGSYIYANFINDPEDATDKGDAIEATQRTDPLGSAATPGAGGVGDPASTDATVATEATDATGATGGAAATIGAGSAVETDGEWVIGDGSFVRYRVTESINGFDTEAVGESSSIAGTITLAGTTATAADFVVDMATFSSDEDRRDGQFNGRIMAVDEFPTSEFHLTSPIEFGRIPAPGESISATATGDLTLRGMTKSVTFEVNAAYDNGIVGIQGSIPVVFADFGIPNPSFATITTEDHGTLEFVLALERA